MHRILENYIMLQMKGNAKKCDAILNMNQVPDYSVAQYDLIKYCISRSMKIIYFVFFVFCNTFDVQVWGHLQNCCITWYEWHSPYKLHNNNSFLIFYDFKYSGITLLAFGGFVPNSRKISFFPKEADSAFFIKLA